jgi:ParB/RepB/Spo0J family partition protein
MSATPTPGELPDNYDRLVSVDKLVHGEHNPRRVRPRDELRSSIATHGINRPLIVRPSPDEDSDDYHVTDGWQRYQAAMELGWEELPVLVFDTALDALTATEMESIVREWSTYQWACYCRSLALELEADSRQQLLEAVAERSSRAAETVRRYLDVLALPEEIHPLLTDGPEGSQQDWAALKNHNPNIRRFGNLWWTVAARLARQSGGLSRDRIVGIAANAVRFSSADDAAEFIEQAAEHPSVPLESLVKQVRHGPNYSQYLVLPRTAVRVSEEEKSAVMEYCAEVQRPLSEILAEQVRELVEGEHEGGIEG